MLIFPAIIKLRCSHPHVPRPFRAPGGNVGAWVCSLIFYAAGTPTRRQGATVPLTADLPLAPAGAA